MCRPHWYSSVIAVRAEDVAGVARDVARHRRRCCAWPARPARPELLALLEPAEPPAQELGLRDLRDHVDQLLLHELVARDGPRELDPVLGVDERLVVAGHRRADRAPADAEAGLGQARERTLHAASRPEGARPRRPPRPRARARWSRSRAGTTCRGSSSAVNPFVVGRHQEAAHDRPRASPTPARPARGCRS